MRFSTLYLSVLALGILTSAIAAAQETLPHTLVVSTTNPVDLKAISDPSDPLVLVTSDDIVRRDAAAMIAYRLTVPATVSLDLYDPTGRIVKSVPGHHRSAGTYTLDLDTGSLDPGTYLYTVASNGVARSRRLVVFE